MSAMKRPFYRRKWFLWPVGIIGGGALAILLAFNLSPWPGALLIRTVFENNAADVKAAMEKHAPDGVASIRDQQYRPGDDDAMLDVYFPEGTADGEALPTLVWTHGGAWLSGNKEDAAPYFELIASEGYTVVAIEYSLAPEKTYPTPIHQINDALAYIQENAARFHIDPDNIIMAGDSAGAQLTSQMAAIITNPDYAEALDITPSLRAEQLRGVVLTCGIYDMEVFLERGDMISGGILGWGVGVTTWAYTGSRDHDSPVLDEMSTIDHVTAEFPPAFITGGNDDPLTDSQSKPLAGRLDEIGVETTTLFYPADHEPKLGHEYQFDLDNEDGQNALKEILAFMKAHTAP